MSVFFYFPYSQNSLEYIPQQFQSQVDAIPTNSGNFNSNICTNANSYFTLPIYNQSYCGIPSEYQPTDPPHPTYSSIPTTTQPHSPPIKNKRREKNPEKQIESAKKNGQSNLVNHFFSFFSHREKSESIVETAIASMEKDLQEREKIFHLFYSIIQAVNAKRGRKYVNRCILYPLLLPEELEKFAPQIIEKVNKMNNIPIQNLCELFRKCIFYFYRSTSVELILTSRRISNVAKQEHLKKRRKICQKMFAQLL